MSNSFFVLGRGNTGNRVLLQPVAPINRQPWILPSQRAGAIIINNNNTNNTNDEQASSIQQHRTFSSNSLPLSTIQETRFPRALAFENGEGYQQQQRKHRTNIQWRIDITRIYGDILKNWAATKQKTTLYGYCVNSALFAHDYKRIAQVWKELKLDKYLERNITINDDEFYDILSERFPIEEANPGKEKQPRNGAKKHKRSNTEWRDLLFEIYTHLSIANTCNNGSKKETVKSYCDNILKQPAHYRRINDVWRELGLDDALASGVCHGDSSILAKINAKYPDFTVTNNDTNTTTKRKLATNLLSYFDREEEDALCETVAGLARVGYPLEKGNLRNICNAYLEADGPGFIAGSGAAGISNDTIARIYKDVDLQAKSNVNPIDPKRAAQADPQILNCFYHQLDTAVQMAHEIDPIVWPESRYADVPPSCLYNADEQGPNPTQLRNPVLIPADMLHEPRLYQNTREGDGKIQMHYSIANIVRADGVQCHPHDLVEGAPPPMVIISDPSSENELDTMEKTERDKRLANQAESDKVVFNEAVLNGWYDNFQPGKRDTLVNPFGFHIRATPTGSMLKITFFDFIVHFRNHLPHDQGPSGRGVILFVDWHCSRECPQSLLTSFFQWNILIIVLPSKTSIWAQPCDNGKNELTAKAIAKAAHDQGILSGEALDYLKANKVFREGLERNCIEQNDELRRTDSNAVVSSFAKTGLYPMDYNNEGWKNAFNIFGKLNELMKKRAKESGQVVPETTWVVKPIPINEREAMSETEISLIKGFLDKEDFLAGDISADKSLSMDIPVLFTAAAIAERLVGSYAQDKDRNKDEPPVPRDACERAALKLVKLVGVTVNDRVDTTRSVPISEVKRDKLRTKLSLLQGGETMVLRLAGSRSKKVVNVTKRGVNLYLVYDGDRRMSSNLEEKTTAQILSTYCNVELNNMVDKLTAEDKKKRGKKNRQARKRQNQALKEEAVKIVLTERKTRNLQLIDERLNDLSPTFLSQFHALLDQEQIEKEKFYDIWQHTLFEPYRNTARVNYKDVIDGSEITKDIDVALSGSDVSAVSHHFNLTLLEIMAKMKGGQGDKIKRKRKRGAGQSTHLGKSGVTVGILIQRGNIESAKADIEARQKVLTEDVSKLKLLLKTMLDIKDDLPDSFWCYDCVKGAKRTALAKLCGVYKSSMKAGPLTTALKDLNLTKDIIESKMQALKDTITMKEAKLPALLAEIQEKEDFLASTEEYVDCGVDRGPMGHDDEEMEEDDDDGDEEDDDG